MCAFVRGCMGRTLVPTTLPQRESWKPIICAEPAVSRASARNFTYSLNVLHHNNPGEGTIYYPHSQMMNPNLRAVQRLAGGQTETPKLQHRRVIAHLYNFFTYGFHRVKDSLHCTPQNNLFSWFQVQTSVTVDHSFWSAWANQCQDTELINSQSKGEKVQTHGRKINYTVLNDWK